MWIHRRPVGHGPTLRERARMIGLMCFGPATSGPYGPPLPPPEPRPRDHRGRLLRQPEATNDVSTEFPRERE